MAKPVESTGLPLVDELAELQRPTIEDYCRASAEYIREVSGISTAKAAQIRLSNALAVVALADLRDTGLVLPDAFAGEREVGGGLRSVKADVSEMTPRDGLTLGIEIKPVHLAVGRAIWNRFGDVRTFAVNLHLKFPFAVVGGILTLPTTERIRSGDDEHWKSTTHLVTRAVGRFIRAGGRITEGDAMHLSLIPLVDMPMKLRLTHEEHAALRDRAAQEGISMQDAARRSGGTTASDGVR